MNRAMLESKNAAYAYLLYSGIATVLFFYFLLIVDPRLIYVAQQPVFFYDWDFFASHLDRPGGLVDWLAKFIGQFFTSAVFGALLLTCVIVAFAFIVRRLYGMFSRQVHWNGEWLVAAPLAVLTGEYFFPIRYVLALLLVLCTAVVFSHISRSWKEYQRALFFLVLVAFLYYLVQAIALLLPFLQLADRENLRTKRLPTLVAFFAAAAVTPFLISRMIPQNPQSLFFGLVPEPVTEKQKVFLIACIILFIVPLAVSKCHAERFRLSPPVLPLLGLLIALASWFYLFDSKVKTVLQVELFAENRQWAPLIQLTDRRPDVNHRLVILHRYRGLYFTGQLGERLFERPLEGPDGLYRSDRTALEYPLDYCDLLIDLGHVNGALHKAYEAWAVEGETPRVLRRLAFLHLAKKEFSAAGKYLSRLEKTGKMRPWLKRYQEICQQRSLQKDAELLRLSLFAEKADFLMRPGFASAELKEIARTQPNRAALEYLLAYELLAGRLDAFMTDLPAYLQLNAELPRNFEEAVILYLNSGLPTTAEQREIAVRRSTLEAFADFIRILQLHGNDKRSAYKELGKYGRTFWFYFLYLDKGAEK
ncbi:MAG: DUF6057 family protein [candidate division KSB1 bacterium]|nr:DUF6057 family protein [candidate division KSB1 bacterium]